MLALIDLTADFSRRFNEEKRRRNSADFSDQEHEAIRLLIGEDGAPTELARIVSARYREIMVDEYQDTNEVQNRIFDAISYKGETFYTVGDVKQSIYRFRLADPRIFCSIITPGRRLRTQRSTTARSCCSRATSARVRKCWTRRILSSAIFFPRNG